MTPTPDNDQDLAAAVAMTAARHNRRAQLAEEILARYGKDHAGAVLALANAREALRRIEETEDRLRLEAARTAVVRDAPASTLFHPLDDQPTDHAGVDDAARTGSSP